MQEKIFENRNKMKRLLVDLFQQNTLHIRKEKKKIEQKRIERERAFLT